MKHNQALIGRKALAVSPKISPSLILFNFWNGTEFKMGHKSSEQRYVLSTIKVYHIHKYLYKYT